MEMLGYNQYQKLAARTQNPALEMDGLFLHSALGLTAEIEEMRIAKEAGDVPAIEMEAGDVLWMIAEMCDSMMFTMNELFTSTSEGMKQAQQQRAALYHSEANPPMPRRRHFDMALMAHCAANISGIAQKTMQGHVPLCADVAVWLQLIMCCLKHVAEYHGFSLRHAMWANIEKLKARYPVSEGFTSERSVNRAE